MEQQTKKSEWKMPELIVLVRHKPEEAVLTACKVMVVGGGNQSTNNDCHMNGTSCTWCDSSAIS